MKQQGIKAKIIVILALIIGLTGTLLFPSIVKSQDNEIKVLLLNGKSEYENILTLNGSTGIIINTQDSVPYTYDAKANSYLSLEFDRLRLLLFETTELAKAVSIIDQVKKLNDMKLVANIEVLHKSNHDVYRVTAGGFVNIDELKIVQQLLMTKLNITGTAVGPFHWSLGAFGNPDEADGKIKELSEKGYNAYLVNVNNQGQWLSEVWVGDSATATEHQQLSEKLVASFPNISLKDAAADAYIINKQIGIINSYGKLEAYPLLSFSKSAIINVKAQANDSGILIKERVYQNKANKYRDQIKIQLYNGQLSAVNQLSLEAYLYAVVGSELYSNWPLEAYKAQAVAARTFAYGKFLNPRNGIAHIYDTTADQVYFGMDQETDFIKTAVDQTKGIVIFQNGQPITSFYSSNAGGMTSSGEEVWGNSIPYVSVKPSAEDKSVLTNTLKWYRIVRNNGQTGYIRSDFIDERAKVNNIGLKYGIVNTENVNFRSGPSTFYFPVLTSLPKGEEIVILNIVYENNSYSWIAGPFTPSFLMENANKYQLESAQPFNSPLLNLQVIERGPSGRVTLLGDGQKPISVKYPDYYRTLLGGLANGVQSTLFDIEQTGRIEVLGARGYRRSVVEQKQYIYVQSADSRVTLSQSNPAQDEYFIMGANGKVRVATKDQAYVLHGKGLGHGLGMSQWGAKGLAESGYNYKDILRYYYNNVELKQIY